MKQDISSTSDIVLLVDTFYEKVKHNKTLAYIFNDVAKVDWPKHLPVMYSFWSGILLGDTVYTGNPMTPHILLSKKTPLTRKEFDEWYALFTETVDELFSGAKAEEAKTRAGHIANLMLYKIETSAS